MRQEDVTFRNHVVDDTVPADQRQTVEVVEIKLRDGTVGAFPVTDIDSESGRRYCDLYAEKYAAFKAGEPDADRVAQLDREIAERQAELDALRAKAKESAAQRKATAKEEAAQAKADQEADAAASKQAEAMADKRDR